MSVRSSPVITITARGASRRRLPTSRRVLMPLRNVSEIVVTTMRASSMPRCSSASGLARSPYSHRKPARDHPVGAVGVVVDQRDARLELGGLRLHEVEHGLRDAEVAEQHDVARRARLRGGRGAPPPRPRAEGPHEQAGDAIVPVIT